MAPAARRTRRVVLFGGLACHALASAEYLVDCEELTQTRVDLRALPVPKFCYEVHPVAVPSVGRTARTTTCSAGVLWRSALKVALVKLGTTCQASKAKLSARESNVQTSMYTQYRLKRKNTRSRLTAPVCSNSKVFPVCTPHHTTVYATDTHMLMGNVPSGHGCILAHSTFNRKAVSRIIR